MKIIIDILFCMILILLLSYAIYKVYKDFNNELSDTKNEVIYLNEIIKKISKENDILRNKYNDTLKTKNDIIRNE